MIRRLLNFPIRMRIENNRIVIYDERYGNMWQFNPDEYTLKEAKKEYRVMRLSRYVIPAYFMRRKYNIGRS